jgi:hypothetical protein
MGRGKASKGKGKGKTKGNSKKGNIHKKPPSPAKTIPKNLKQRTPPTRSSPRTAPSPIQPILRIEPLSEDDMHVDDSATETNPTRHVFRNGQLLNVGEGESGAETPTHEETDDDALSPPGGVATGGQRAISPASHRRPKGKASAPSSAERRKKKRAADLAILKRNGYESWIGAAARQAVFDSMPFAGIGKAPCQFLYWANTPRNACALRLIKRTVRLQERAVQFGGPDNLSENIAAEVSLHARKARNKHIYELRKLFLLRNRYSKLPRV